MKATPGTCDMCGKYCAIRQRAHIVAEGKKSGANLLLLCPTCHLMFDTVVKPKVFKALSDAGVQRLPKSWKESIYDQAAKASGETRLKRSKKRNP